MASRSLGVLTLDLVARTAGFTAGMTQAERAAASSTKKIQASFAGLGTAFRTALGGLSVGLLIRKFVEETSKAQTAIAQLNAAIKANGSSAGFTTPQLVQMSKEIQNTTKYSDEAALAAETMLIQFGKLSGDQFERALRLSADFAQASGKSLEDAALSIGRATSNASKGVTRLAVVGATFSANQLKLIANLKATGRAVEANEIIFKELERAIGGKAAAEVNTLGGALAQLKNKFDDLFETDTEGTAGIVAVIKLISANLELIAKAATAAAIAYAGFKAVVIAGNIAKSITAYFVAIQAARVEAIAAAAASRAKAVQALAEAAAAEAVTKAELERTFAMVQGTRATQARILADRENIASAATRATVARNAVKAEGAFAAAAAAQSVAGRKAGEAAIKATAATTALGAATAKTASRFTLLTAPFASIARFASSNPFTAIAGAVVAAGLVLFNFRKDIKLTEDGVVDLGNASQAAFELMGEALAPVGEFFQSVFTHVRAFFDLVIPDTISWGDALKGVLRVIPGFQLLIPILDKVGAKIEERAREIAAIDKAAKELAERNAAVGGAGAGPGTTVPEVDVQKQAAALERIKDMVASLQKQNVALDQGELAATKFSLKFGELKELFATAGPQAEKYRQALLDATAAHVEFEKAVEAKRATAQAVKSTQELIQSNQQEIDTLDLSRHALSEYSIAHGQLATQLALTGEKQDEFTKKLREQNDELEKQDIAKQVKEINLQLLELRGQTTEAITIKFDIDNAALQEALERTGNTAGLEALANLRELTIAQASFNKLREDAALISDQLATQEERIRNSQETGAQSEFESLANLGKARELTVMQLQEILEKLEAIAVVTKDPAQLASVEAFRAEIEALAEQTDLFAQKINSELSTSIQSAFGDWIKGTKSLGDAFSDMLEDIQNKLIDLILQNYFQQLFAGGGGIGAAIGGIFGFAKGGYLGHGEVGVAGERGPELVFGGKTGLSILSHADSMRMMAMMSKSMLFPSRDFGGRGYPGQPVMIGKGAQPELFVPNAAGKFFPNAEMGGAQVNNFNFTVQAPQGTVSRATEQQIAAAAARGIADASRRNN